MTLAPGTAVWFARHESRLAWRDWLSMITAGRRERLRRVVFAILVFAIFMHFVAYWMVGRYADVPIDKPMLVTITASILLSWLLMVSQAMESMTRAFYSRFFRHELTAAVLSYPQHLLQAPPQRADLQELLPARRRRFGEDRRAARPRSRRRDRV